MIRKMQFKFILLSMSVLLAMLIIIIGAINIANYTSVIQEADEILSVLSQNKGHFPKGDPSDHKFSRKMSPELPYESRYFSVLLDSTGAVVQTETNNIAAIDAQDAAALGANVFSESSDTGFVENFRYRKTAETNGVRIIFLDCGRKIDSFYKFLIASILMSLVGFLLVFATVVFFSGRIIRPFAESYEKQKQFITDAGHEIKTPLTIINADVDILEMEYGENEWLADIQKHVKRLTSLTNDLVYLARMEESEHSTLFIDFPVSDVVSETAASFHVLAQSQNKHFSLQIQPLLSMRGDEKAIQQLVSILLDNALKYSPEGGTVTLTLEKQSRQIRLSVYNSTESVLPKDSMNLLFERFYRADSSRNSQTGGHGIGLSIAKAIVSSHGGKISASSQDEKSLQITASFPI